MTPISRRYELKFLTYWRMSIEGGLMQMRWLLPFAFLLPAGLIAFRFRDAPLQSLLLSIGITVFYEVVSLSLGLPAMVLIVTVLSWVTNPELRGERAVTIGDDGIRLTRPGRDSLIPWRSLVDVRATPWTLLLRTDHWEAVPVEALGSRAALQDAFLLCQSLRTASETVRREAAPVASTDNPYAPPTPTERAKPGRTPNRRDEVLVRVVIPPRRLSWTGTLAKVARYRPVTILPLVAAAFVPSLILPDRKVALIIGVGATIAVLWRRNASRTSQMGGQPEVVDLTEQGIDDWLAMRQIAFGWADVLMAVEDTGGFFLSSRGGEYLYLPHDCVEGGASDPVRELIRRQVGSRARLRDNSRGT